MTEYTISHDVDLVIGTGVRYRVGLNSNKKEIGHADIIVHLKKEYIELGFIEIDKDYQGKGLSKVLHRAISELYHKEELLRGKIISRKFVNPIAEKVAKWAVETGLYPEESWDEKYIERSYKKSPL